MIINILYRICMLLSYLPVLAVILADVKANAFIYTVIGRVNVRLKSPSRELVHFVINLLITHSFTAGYVIIIYYIYIFV